MLEAQHLSIALGGRRIVEPLDLTLGPGELTGLIGANGSGKSTLLRALAGLLPAEQGGVFLDGKPLGKLAPRALARTLAFLPQAPECHWPLTADRVVALGRLPFRGGSSELDAEHVTRALEAVDALHLRERAVNELSGGERARIFLARALAGDPKLLLVDEPGAGLDPFHQLQLMETLQAFARRGMGILVVMHDLGLAARFCSGLLALHQGRLVASGEPEAVLSDALLAKAHGITAFRGRCQDAPVLVPWSRVGGRS
ncbi:MAG: ABC transporter ATP-binding protein [Chthoniobacteraceae bacterium]|nr:ABC transporter ATP-binding protein [Chthoniobacteraceae bacterium]